MVGERRFLGLFTSKAYAEHADVIPILRHKLEAILDDSGAPAGLARLQGDHHHLQLHAQGGALPGLPGGAGARGADGAQPALQRRGAGHPAARPAGPRRERDGHPAARPLQRRGAAPHPGRADAALPGRGAQLPPGDERRRPGAAALLPLRADGGGARGRAARRWSATSARSSAPGRTSSTRSWRASGTARRGAAASAPSTGPPSTTSTAPPPLPEVAVLDVLQLERMRAAGESVSVTLHEPRGRGRADAFRGITALKLYLRGERLVLSDFMPILDNAGLRVVEVTPFALTGGGAAGDHDLLLRRAGARRRRRFRWSAPTSWPRRSWPCARATPRTTPSTRSSSPPACAGARSTSCAPTPTTPSRSAPCPRASAPARALAALPRARPPPGRATSAQRFDPAGRGRPRATPEAVRQQIAAALDSVTTLADDRALPPHRRPGRRHDPHQLLPPRRRRPHLPQRRRALRLLQVPLRRRGGAAQEPAALRGLRLLLAHGGHPPARGARLPRRHPLVRPARRLPHRDPGAGADADRQERGDRPQRLEGRLHHQAPASPTATR